jgi:hypothetical protein
MRPNRGHSASAEAEAEAFWFSPQQPSITLLGNEQVREVDLFKLELDGFDEFAGNKIRTSAPRGHRLRHRNACNQT